MSRTWPDCGFLIKKGEEQNIEVGKKIKTISCLTDEPREITVKAIYEIRFLDNGNIVVELDIKEKKAGR